MNRILVTGGCGYIGTVLVPKLLEDGHRVTVVDRMWFGNALAAHDRLTWIQADINEASDKLPLDFDTIIHLAAVANDPCGDLDPKVTWEANALGTMRLIDAAYRAGVERFIYASSGSVYGVRPEANVTEDLPCVPLSEYNKTKMVAERAVLSYANEMSVCILRPATVCGVSPRMRLDVVVNMLTMQALTKGEITVLGGSQVRPNIHIQDMTDLYVHMVLHNHQGVFNAGFENYSVMQIAEKVQAGVGAFANKNLVKIKVLPSADNRSYRLNSNALLNITKWRPKHSVECAIDEICRAYYDGSLKDIDAHYNLRSMPR